MRRDCAVPDRTTYGSRMPLFLEKMTVAVSELTRRTDAGKHDQLKCAVCAAGILSFHTCCRVSAWAMRKPA